MDFTAFINGKPESVVDISDRGMQYGDGVFETIAITNGKPEFLDRHFQRLDSGCKRLGIEFYHHRELYDEIMVLSSNQSSAVIKIQISSGSSVRGYRRSASSIANRIVKCIPSTESFQSHKRQGIKLRLCRHRLSINPALAGIKHLNRLDQVIARDEWSASDIHEGVMLDADGYVIEGTMSNLFFVSQGTITTAKLDRSGVAGIIRSVVIEQAKQHNVEVVVKSVCLRELIDADEVFMTNSVIGVWPVSQFETHQYQVGPCAFDMQNWVLNATDRFAA